MAGAPESPFIQASTWTRQGETRFSTTVDAAWYQGRGAFGGIIAAGVLRAMMTVVDDPRRRPRSLDVHYCAPATAGPLEVEVVVERAGTSFMTLSARALQQGKLVVLATGAFSFPRDGKLRARYALRKMPEAPRAADVDPVPDGMTGMPTFTQFFEYRFCVGDGPFAGSSTPRLGGWLRPRVAQPLDAPLVAALLDAWPPAVFARLDAPAAGVTVNLTIDFHVALPLPMAPPHPHALVVLNSENGDGGTADDRAELWSEDGVHLASCRQLVALL